MTVIVVAKACHKEIKKLPKAIREDLADALARLELGQTLSMPLSRPMPSIGKGVHELRLKDASGIYRVVYAMIVQGDIYILSAFKKTSMKTPLKEIRLAKKRLQEILS